METSVDPRQRLRLPQLWAWLITPSATYVALEQGTLQRAPVRLLPQEPANQIFHYSVLRGCLSFYIVNYKRQRAGAQERVCCLVESWRLNVFARFGKTVTVAFVSCAADGRRIKDVGKSQSIFFSVHRSPSHHVTRVSSKLSVMLATKLETGGMTTNCVWTLFIPTLDSGMSSWYGSHRKSMTILPQAAYWGHELAWHCAMNGETNEPWMTKPMSLTKFLTTRHTLTSLSYIEQHFEDFQNDINSKPWNR